MSYTDSAFDHGPTDQDLEALLSDTRSILAERAEYEADRVNRDLDVLLHRVRGNQRASRAHALRVRNQVQDYYQNSGEFSDSKSETDGTLDACRKPSKEEIQAEHPIASPAETVPSAQSVSSPAPQTNPDSPNTSAPATEFTAVKSIPADSSTPNPSEVEELEPAKSSTSPRSSTSPEVDLPIIPVAQVNQFQPGVHLILAQIDHSPEAVSLARHLSLRTAGPSQVVLGGAKTLTAGNEQRARNPKELTELLAASSKQALYLVLIDSPVTAHQRAFEKMIAELNPVRTWAVVDFIQPTQERLAWLETLPGGQVTADLLAAINVWETTQPELPLPHPPLGTIDLAPASPALWQLVVDHCSTYNSTGKEA